MGPNDNYDLFFNGGESLDTSQVPRVKRYIGTRHGKLETLAENLTAAHGFRVLDTSGKIIIPGLVDLRAHTPPHGSVIGILPDKLI